MDKEDAIRVVSTYIQARYPDYLADQGLDADRFEIGWVVYPKIDPTDIDSLRIGQTIFVLGDNGEIVESSSSLPPGFAEEDFVQRYGEHPDA